MFRFPMPREKIFNESSRGVTVGETSKGEEFMLTPLVESQQVGLQGGSVKGFIIPQSHCEESWLT